eukprot:CAMPEP_0195105108 /NCGR_PEP_ID=MMETSP0448-20130528/74978_1 /TAXON_ID=66468 /ORGANISM="Heterocapsa triquestra, Strain CCMP 448" /LENGTH=121 /DNA_ID=CAMNT_0040141067 /DNA_START=49 /DNA_END=412 /DNA_ORIENTATION=+
MVFGTRAETLPGREQGGVLVPHVLGRVEVALVAMERTDMGDASSASIDVDAGERSGIDRIVGSRLRHGTFAQVASRLAATVCMENGSSPSGTASKQSTRPVKPTAVRLGKKSAAMSCPADW